MLRFFKIFGIITASILGFILLVAVMIKTFENNLAHLTAKKVSEEFAAPIDISTVDFNLIRSYPNSKIELNDLWLKDSLNQDTIAGIERLFLSVNAHEAINGSYLVNAIELDGLALNYTINSDTISNIDFLMSAFAPSDTTTTVEGGSEDSIPLKVNLKQLLMKNILCTYFDSTSNIGAKILIPEISINANVNGDSYQASSKGKITIKDIRYGDYNTDLIQQTSLDYDFSYNDGEVVLNNVLFTTDGMRLALYGEAKIGDTITMNTTIKESFVDLGQLIQYAPKAMLQEFGLIDAKGILTFSSEIQGAYSDSLMPEINAQFAAKDVAIQTQDYPHITSFNLEGWASNGHLRNNSTSELHIQHCAITTEKSGITARADIKNIDQPSYNFHSQGHLDLDEVVDHLPKGLLDYLQGKVNWKIATHGTLPAEIDEAFTDRVLAQTSFEFSTQDLSTKMDTTLCIENMNGSLRYDAQEITLDSLSVTVPDYDLAIQNISSCIAFDGSVNDLATLKLNIKNFDLEADSAFLTAQGQVENLEAPTYDLEATMDLNLAKLQKFMPDTLITSINGRVTGRLKSAASLNLDSLEMQGMAVAFEQSDMELAFENINAQMTDTLYSINDLNLAMAMANDTIDVKHFSGDYKGNTFNIFDTQISNAYKAALLNQHEELKVRTHLAFGDIDYSDFEPFMIVDSTTSEEDTSATTPINYTMNIKGDVTMERFYMEEYVVDSTMTVRDLDIRNFSNKFLITDSTYIIDSMQLNAFEGYINTSFRYDIKDDKEVVAMKGHVSGMDFKSLLYKMDNFGQSDLTDENISGQLTGDLFAEAFIEGDSVPMDKIRARGDMTLDNGGVYNFEPIEELSKFTGIKELDNIRFQTLNTQFFLFKGATYLPKTKIVSTAVDANFYGMQSLKEDYEYHIEMFLGDVLTGKSNNLMERQEKAASGKRKEVKRNGVELRAQSLNGKTKYGFDNNKSQEKMSKKIRLQERVLNLVFHPNLFDFSTEEK